MREMAWTGCQAVLAVVWFVAFAEVIRRVGWLAAVVLVLVLAGVFFGVVYGAHARYRRRLLREEFRESSAPGSRGRGG